MVAKPNKGLSSFQIRQNIPEYLCDVVGQECVSCSSNYIGG